MKTSFSSRISIVISCLIVLEIATQTAAVIILGKAFDFPDVLRKPANEVLQLFYTNQNSIIPGYYLFLLSSLLYIPLTAVLVRAENLNASIWKQVLMLAGVATAIFQSIGFSRWIFIIPALANQYVDPDTSFAIKQSIEMIYTVLNTYFGMTIGEHLGFIAMALWTLSVAMIISFHQFYKWVGIVIAAVVLISVAENFGGRYASFFGQLNFVANSLWTVWLLILSIKFWREKMTNPTITSSSLNKLMCRE